MIRDEAYRARYMQGTVSSFLAAYDALWTQKVEPLDFDTFVIVDTHWFGTTEYVVNAHERLQGVYTSEELPRMLHGYAYDYAGNPALADLIAEEASENSGGRSRCYASRDPGLPQHYGTLNVMHFLNRRRDRKVVSVSTVQTAEAHNDLDLGAAIGRAVARYDGRVVFVASGSLSHAFHTFDDLLERSAPDARNVSRALNREMDLRVIELLKAGRHREVLELTPSYRAACTPEGKFAHYLMMAAALGGAEWTAKGTQYGEYENAIGTGNAIVWFDA